MSDKIIIDINNWDRKEHYAFFGSMDDPFFGFTAKADFSRCYKHAKENHASFFLYSLHSILHSMNSIEHLRLRIEHQNVVLYDKIGASPTIAREDGSFGFGYFEYYPDREFFVKEAQKEIERVKNNEGLSINENENRQDIIYFSSIPWISFTDVKQAGNTHTGESIVRVTTGKFTLENDKIMMPVSILANHALVDGSKIGRFFEMLDKD